MALFITQLASTESANGGIFDALGIDWRVLVLQMLAFAVLVWFLGKFVYPILVKTIDSREAAIEESVQAAREAEAKAEQSQSEINSLLKQARDEAGGIVELAHKEAQQQIKDAEDRAKQRADQIVSEAREQLSRDIIKARKELRADTVELVAQATERVVREKVDTKKDTSLIEDALKGAA